MSEPRAAHRVVVIGGGITGLSAAHHLIEQSGRRNCFLEATLLESSNRLGGVIRTIHRDGFLIETGPDNFITAKPWAVELSKRLGLEGDLIGTNASSRRALVARGNRLLAIPEGFVMMAPSRFLPMAFSPLFSWGGKFRMAMDLFLPAKGSGGDESVGSFVRRRFGRQALERIVQPLIGGIYTADVERLSLQATLPRFLEMESKYGSVIRGMRKDAATRASRESGARYSLFTTFRKGLQTLVDALSERLGDGVARLNKCVTRISRNTGGDGRNTPRWAVFLEDGTRLETDGVIVSLPTHRAAPMLKEVDDQLADLLSSIDYASSAVVHCAYRRDAVPHPLDGFGFVVPSIEKRHIMATSFTSVKYEGRAPEGHVLLRAFLGGAIQRQILEGDDEDLVDAVREDFNDLLGITAAPLFSTVHRHRETMPQYEVGHLQRVEAIRSRLAQFPGLELAGNGFEGVGIPDCVHSGESVAERILSTLGSTGR